MNTDSFFSKIEEYALKENVPILRKEGVEFLLNFIEEKHIKTALEIGTAVGYSALKMSSKGVSVTSIERDINRYNTAKENVSISPYKDKITLVLGDALEVKIEGKFDLIFIDAAKGKNKEFLNTYKNNLNNNGYILIDNMLFHGLVGKSNEIKKRRIRSLVRKIEDFISYMDNQTEFKVTKINVGDGLYLLERINNE